MSSVDSSAKFGSVLIVAKCNVNFESLNFLIMLFHVLIVAKCNVNVQLSQIYETSHSVLIVAKCNVNGKKFEEDFSNSVY